MKFDPDDISSRLDPELAPQFRALPRPERPLNLEDVRLLQLQYGELLKLEIAPDESVAIEDRLIPGPAGAPDVPVRIYRPLHTPADTALLWIHGGGFIMGHHATEDIMALPWVRATGCTVVSVGYRLAPEHPFPAGADDCYAALCWIAGGENPLSFKPRKLAVGGMSAGGCLAASTALRARDLGGPKLDFQLLLVPVLDNHNELPSTYEITDPRAWNRHSALVSWEMYLGPDFLGEASPYAAPARAQDLSGLPPCFVEAAEVDVLRDEAIEYARRLMQAGVTTELHVYPGAYHASTFGRPDAAVSRQASADITNALKKALA